MELPNIDYISNDYSIHIRLQFITSNRMRLTHVGKNWPLTTQCLVFYNGCLQGFGTVVKHSNDSHNPVIACKLAAKKALECIKYKSDRASIWNEFNKVYNLEK